MLLIKFSYINSFPTLRILQFSLYNIAYDFTYFCFFPRFN